MPGFINEVKPIVISRYSAFIYCELCSSLSNRGFNERIWQHDDAAHFFSVPQIQLAIMVAQFFDSIWFNIPVVAYTLKVILV